MEQSEIKVPKLSVGQPSITMAPLVDIVFLLLIFFVVATEFPEKTGIKIEKPSAQSESIVDEKKFVLSVDKEKNIYYLDKQIQLSDVTRLVKERLEMLPESYVFLKVDKQLSTQGLIDVMDACKAAGSQRIAIATAKNE